MTLREIAQNIQDEQVATDGQGNTWEAQALRDALTNNENADWESTDYLVMTKAEYDAQDDQD